MFYIILGLLMIYATVHFIILSFVKKYSERSTYEKIVSIAGVVFIGLVYLGIMMSE